MLAQSFLQFQHWTTSLHSRVGEAGGQLHFIAPDEFMLAEGDITITFVRNQHKQLTAMKTQWSLAESPSTARKLK